MPPSPVYLLRWGLANFPHKHWPQTAVLLISASQVAGITGVSHQSWPVIWILEMLSHLILIWQIRKLRLREVYWLAQVTQQVNRRTSIWTSLCLTPDLKISTAILYWLHEEGNTAHSHMHTLCHTSAGQKAQQISPEPRQWTCEPPEGTQCSQPTLNLCLAVPKGPLPPPPSVHREVVGIDWVRLPCWLSWEDVGGGAQGGQAPRGRAWQAPLPTRRSGCPLWPHWPSTQWWPAMSLYGSVCQVWEL
jgi:hypothetical protein